MTTALRIKRSPTPAASRRRRCATTNRSAFCRRRRVLRPDTGCTTRARSTGSRSSRAKQLGCSLDEIIDLTTAWDGGQCGPIQDRLRRLVADKISAAQDQLAELATFTAELHQAANALERHRPDGACDAECGCVSDPGATETVASTIHAVRLSTKPAAAGEPAIACTLSPGSMKGRMSDWQTLLAHVERREPIDGGVRSHVRSVGADR